jgi:hypothetical protein
LKEEVVNLKGREYLEHMDVDWKVLLKFNLQVDGVDLIRFAQDAA